jgi:uncharacterized damage-inducible protein DinB
MDFSINKSIQVLERTPAVLNAMLHGIDDSWTSVNEGAGSWSVYDIIGHFIHGEQTDWVTRAAIILSDKADKQFEPFDRFAQFSNSNGKPLAALLEAFTQLRKENIAFLRSDTVLSADFSATGIHPAFGPVSLSQLLSAWVVHDLNHIAQISRVMAKQYALAVGPWTAYLSILQ